MENTKITNWWKELTNDEMLLLLEVLYNLDLIDYGIIQDERTGQYKKEQLV